MKKKTSLFVKTVFGKTKKGYGGLLKCNGCGKVLTRDRIGAMCGQCYNERIVAPNT